MRPDCFCGPKVSNYNKLIKINYNC
ncbi:protein of unknown function [Aminobacter niigataensis]|nr:protein of unknown function [Aminobacter niigataensis]